jgi:D-aminopeptidase
MASEALNVIIGGHGRDAADPAGQSFNGLIDDVRIYDEDLSEAAIMAAMNNVPEPSSAGLLALTGLLFLRRRR